MDVHLQYGQKELKALLVSTESNQDILHSILVPKKLDFQASRKCCPRR